MLFHLKNGGNTMTKDTLLEKICTTIVSKDQWGKCAGGVILGSALMGATLVGFKNLQDAVPGFGYSPKVAAEMIQRRDFNSQFSTNGREENVIGGPEADRFIEIRGERAYLTIDGKPTSHYFEKE